VKRFPFDQLQPRINAAYIMGCEIDRNHVNAFGQGWRGTMAGGDVCGFAALLETKPKGGAELELDLLGSVSLACTGIRGQSLTLDPVVAVVL
jgi:hypothetical protein